MRLINDWAPETKSLLESLIAAGCTLHSGNNGEDSYGRAAVALIEQGFITTAGVKAHR